MEKTFTFLDLHRSIFNGCTLHIDDFFQVLDYATGAHFRLDGNGNVLLGGTYFGPISKLHALTVVGMELDRECDPSRCDIFVDTQ